jgi:hypothetical protein
MSHKDNEGRRSFLKNVGLAGVGVVGFNAGAAGAEKPSPVETLPAEYRPGSPGVTVLTPEPGSRETAKKAHIVLVLLVENDDRLQQVVLARGREPLEYSIVADPEAGTYEVTDFQYLQTPQTTSSDSGMGQKQTDSKSESQVGIEGTSYYGPFTVQITTHDPVECRLCRTKQTLEWAHDTNYDATYITDRNWTAVWWAPTGCGTHWYNDWAKFTDRYEGSSKCYTECEGQYYNDDYGDNNKRTYSWHKLHITGYSSGSTDYWGTADHWGEGSGNLHTHVKVV